MDPISETGTIVDANVTNVHPALAGHRSDAVPSQGIVPKVLE